MEEDEEMIDSDPEEDIFSTSVSASSDVVTLQSVPSLPRNDEEINQHHVEKIETYLRLASGPADTNCVIISETNEIAVITVETIHIVVCSLSHLISLIPRINSLPSF